MHLFLVALLLFLYGGNRAIFLIGGLMNIDAELQKVGLNHDTYEAIMSDVQNKLDGNNDLEWNEIVNKYNINISVDLFRKSQSRPFGGAFVKEYFEQKKFADSPSSYVEQLAEIRRERQKLFDERSAWNKLQREGGRYEQIFEHLEKLIKESQFKPIAYKNQAYHDDNDLLIMISDVHYGLDAKSNFGDYNSEIAQERMQEYLEKILKIQSIYCSENTYVFLGGDLINGNIHQTTQLQNRENVVEQIQGVSEIISNFLYELSKCFQNVYVNGISGNHSRINKKDMVLRDERLDSLVPWYIQAKLNNINNIVFINDQYDSTIAYFNIRGNQIIGVHGDVDAYSESGVSKLTMMLNFKPYAVLYGHLHKCSYDDVAGVRLVRSGSFCGTVDDYTISKRITGHASQMVCVIDKDGIMSMHPIDLH